jgi:Xaa-Pro aminopeptidase
MNNFLLQNENAIYYECGYSCDNCIYINLSDETFFITDNRYKIDALQNLNKNCQLIITKDILKTTKKILQKSKIKKIKFDPNDFNLLFYFDLTKDLNIKFIKKPYFSQLKRVIKTNDEIKLIKKAMQIGKDGFVKFQKYLSKDGFNKTEQYLAYMASTYMSDFGKYDLSFNPIVAINKNSAKPHAFPSNKVYHKNDILLFDGGIKYKRYCSDRTVTFGNNLGTISKTQRKQKFKDKFQQKIYDIVLKAQETTIKKTKTGMKASKIDKIAREIIDKKGFGKYFVHSTGHGVGLDIHEYPIISSKSDTIIEENMAFTIEPGIYIPNKFGVRIEDTIYMHKNKAVVL